MAEELHRTALLATTPGTVVSRGDGVNDGGIGLLEGRTLVDGRPAAYVCRNFTCRLPATTTEELTAELARARAEQTPQGGRPPGASPHAGSERTR